MKNALSFVWGALYSLSWAILVLVEPETPILERSVWVLAPLLFVLGSSGFLLALIASYVSEHWND